MNRLQRLRELSEVSTKLKNHEEEYRSPIPRILGRAAVIGAGIGGGGYLGFHGGMRAGFKVPLKKIPENMGLIEGAGSALLARLGLGGLGAAAGAGLGAVGGGTLATAATHRHPFIPKKSPDAKKEFSFHALSSAASRLRELAALSDKSVKELASKEKDGAKDMVRSAVTGAGVGGTLGGLAGAVAMPIALKNRGVRKAALRAAKAGDYGRRVHTGRPRFASYTIGAAERIRDEQRTPVHIIRRVKSAAKIGAIAGATQGVLTSAFKRDQNKEFGLLTKNEAAYDKDGHFTGIENHYNGPGIAEAAGGAALVGAGLGAGHVGVMKKYGTRSVRRTADFLPPRQVDVPVGQAYRRAGRDVLAKIRSLAGKRFSAKDRLKELAEKSVALKSFDQKVDENGHPILDTAVGAGLGAGAFIGHRAIMNNYGQNGAGIGAAYGAAAKDAKAGFQNAFNPPSTSEGSGMAATASTNSPLSHDGAKFSGTAPSVDAAPGVGGTAKVVEDSEEALKAMKPGVAYRAGAAAGGLGSKIRGLLSGLRKVV